MKTALGAFTILFAVATLHAIVLQGIPHKVVFDKRVFTRDANDRRYSVWTDDPAKVREVMKEFGAQSDEGIVLPKGAVFAVFLNDRLEEDLIQITCNQATSQIFADYADSNIEFKLRMPPKGQKHSHITGVIFTPPFTPSHLGLRSMVANGLSDKK